MEGAGSSRMASAVTNWFCFMKFISISIRLAQDCSYNGRGMREKETGEERREEGERRGEKGREKIKREEERERECIRERQREKKRQKDRERTWSLET